MASKIEWTEDVWNPLVGCSVVSPGCTHCYAMRDAWRKGFNPKTPQYHGLTEKVNGNPVWTGEVRLVEHKLDEPLRRQKPTMYFVNSMSDLFHESVPDEWIDKVFAVMALAPQHTFQVLTKRAERMREYMTRPGRGYDGKWIESPGMGARDGIRREMVRLGRYSGLDDWPLPNVWLGVSAEDQKRADERIPDLLATPAAVRWVSAEPLLGPVDVVDWLPPRDSVFPRLDWIVVGGESGPKARPMHPAWARSIRDQCQTAGVAYFFKQWGNWGEVPVREDLPAKPWMIRQGDIFLERDGTAHYVGPDLEGPDKDGIFFPMRNLGKKAAGRLLDGREWSEYPKVRQ